jgi:DnaJ like chaperone protein
MSFVGKLLGALLGFLALKNPLGALLGLLVGHQFDRGLAKRPGKGTRRRRRSGIPPQERQQIFFETTFMVMGHIAKADGRVSEVEIAAARQVMQRMRLGEADTRLAMEQFSRGKRPEFSLSEQVARFDRYCGGEPQLLQLFLEIQVDVTLTKGAVTTVEREALCRIADLLGVSRFELLRLESLLRARQRFRPDQPQPDPVADLDKAYEALGVAAQATNAEVKTAYRRLMNEHHPDKQVARGVPPALLKVAEERTREIRRAYDTIRQQRGFR